MRSALTLLDEPFALITDLVRAHAAERPDHIAVIEGESSLTYAALDAAADRIAAGLQRDCLRKGEAIAICADASCDYVATFLGGLQAGVAVAPLSPSSTPEALAMMVRDCGARLVFVDDASSATLDRAAAPPATARISLSGERHLPLRDWAPSAPPAVLSEPPIGPEDAFNVIYSSGTTGAPKGIVQPHGMRWGHVRRARAFAYGPDAVTVLSTPLYSNTTLVSLFPTLGMGGTAVLMRKFDALGFLELAQRVRATHAMLVPVQYRRILDRPEFDSFDLSSFRMKTCTSAPFSAALKAEALRRWPGGLVELYGMTEGGGSCLLFAHEHPDKLHTVGRPAEGHDIRIIDEALRELPAGETGEIVGRSGAMMTGYHNQPARTAEAEWTSPEGLRFIRTGDVGRFDEDGFLVLGDRMKDMIISGGFNIYPSDLEAELARHPAVAECAVVAAPSREWGETPVAFAVLRAGMEATGEELKAWANARLGKMQRLSRVELTGDLPRSSIGKVLKRELRDRLTSLDGQ